MKMSNGRTTPSASPCKQGENAATSTPSASPCKQGENAATSTPSASPCKQGENAATSIPSASPSPLGKRVARRDKHFPALLAKIHDPPPLLYVRGALPKSGDICLTVVGTRKPTAYGRAVIEMLIPPLAASGIVIVSGLARGIDGLAHEATLTAHGRTLAVLGSGIDPPSIYPSEHRDLAERIIQNGGAVISEFPPGTEPRAEHFPQRNRILAGLSQATLVVEAQKKSGSLITARFALDEGREVLAVPGPITNDSSWGTNWILREGATPITSADDLFLALKLDPQKCNLTVPQLDGKERAIYDLLSNQPLHIDALLATSKLDITILSATLSRMELSGLVKNIGGMQFVRV